jgi:hypothetical protein
MLLQMELEQGPEVVFELAAWVKHTVGPDSGAMYLFEVHYIHLLMPSKQV